MKLRKQPQTISQHFAMNYSTTLVQSSSVKQAIYDSLTRIRNRYWAADGTFTWQDRHGVGGFRGAMMHCLAYFHSDDPQAHDLANRILHTQNTNTPCHFAPSLVLEILYEHDDKLEPEIKDELIAYLKRHLSYMMTDDLQCHGYNDNHPHKAAHALVLGGQYLNQSTFIEVGRKRLAQAVELFERNDFPSEYNSPNYLPVSLKPLAELVNGAEDTELREMALWLERYHWNDLAEHFDGRVGLPAGPFCRGYAGDYRGMLNNTVMLLAALFPQQFDFDVVHEFFVKQEHSPLIDPSEKARLPFYQSHIVWYITPEYHVEDKTIKRIFEDKTDQTLIGHIESGVTTCPCPLPGGPAQHTMGPRQGNITSYFGKNYSLGTAQYSWLNGNQAHSMIACIHKSQHATPTAAANYYTRMFYDENAPLLDEQIATHNFTEEGEARTVQYRNAAMVLYNPHPFYESAKRIRTGIFRPLWFTKPNAIYVGQQALKDMDHIQARLEPITIDEGASYVGIHPLRLTDRGQSRHADLQIQMHGNELAILISSFEGWGAKDLTYNQVMYTHSGFVIEVHDAQDWPSFDAFRKSFAQAIIEDEEYALMRRTRYQHNGIELAASYNPIHSTMRYATGKAIDKTSITLSQD
jgi:hypothetical protein